jgi:hypothetical protein
MPWNVFDYRDNRNRNVIREWLRTAGKVLAGKADAKIRMLHQFGPHCPKGMLADSSDPHIDKLRILGKDNTRILVCKGPVNVGTEYTLLSAQPEKDRRLPKGALEQARERRAEVIADPTNRREIHEFE